jgi:RNA polymerase primary sigma factor
MEQPIDGPRGWDLVLRHRRCVLPLAWEYRHLGVPLEDLESEGNVGLLEAAARFDAGRGVSFLSYAAWWIRKCILQAVSRQALLVRLPRGRVEQLARIRRAERDLSARLSRAPTVEEIANEAGLRVRHVEGLLLQARREVSLDEPVGRDGTLRLEDVLAGPAAGPDRLAALADGERLLHALVRLLPERQRVVVVLRYGLDGEEPRTLSEIAYGLDLSRERVRQIEAAALRALRGLLDPGRNPVSA